MSFGRPSILWRARKRACNRVPLPTYHSRVCVGTGKEDAFLDDLPSSCCNSPLVTCTTQGVMLMCTEMHQLLVGIGGIGRAR